MVKKQGVQKEIKILNSQRQNIKRRKFRKRKYIMINEYVPASAINIAEGIVNNAGIKK